MAINRFQLEQDYRDLGKERTDLGRDYTLDDHLQQARQSIKTGVTAEQHAEALSIPVEYARKLRDFLAQD